METERQTATLEGWMKDADFPVYWGYVYNHPQLPDGMHIHTSAIVDVNEEEGWLKTLNTDYELSGEGMVESIKKSLDEGRVEGD